jgi:peptide-methionine (S)-S-oxide reductase
MAIDSGRTGELKSLIDKYPELIRKRLVNNEEGYFKDPYLLWFIADNPIRSEKLPDNILEITQELVQAVKREAPDTYQYQVDYALGLVASGRIPLECGVQIEMMDILVDAGASPNCAMTALTNGNLEAAQHLLDRGDVLNLVLAACLERMGDIDNLIGEASANEKITALAAVAYYGNEKMIKYLLELGVDPNGFPDADSGFHNHATALHQAVSSGSLSCVKLLLNAGARFSVRDKLYDGTPLEWAAYLRLNTEDETKREDFLLIEDYLRSSK